MLGVDDEEINLNFSGSMNEELQEQFKDIVVR